MKITSLCASHIDTKYRLDALKRSLRSIIDQPTQVIISTSYNNDMETLINDIEEEFKTVKFVLHPSKNLSQFQHYNVLRHYIDTQTWCMFFDDDDFSHPNRVNTYIEYIVIHNKNPSVYMANAQNNIYNHPQAWEMDFKQIDSQGTINNGGQEYYMFAVRNEILHFFCDNCSDKILEWCECDLIFRSFLRCLPCSIITHSSWLYAHTMCKPPIIDEGRNMNTKILWNQAKIRLMMHPLFDEYKNTIAFINLYNNTLCLIEMDCKEKKA
jgi:hypothetical protein